jgi:hypothetical protein
MMCEHKYVHVYVKGIANVFPDKKFIPRFVSVGKHDKSMFIRCRVRPFITYSELHPRRKAVAKEQCGWGLSFDENHPRAMSEDRFIEAFVDFIEGYDHIEICGGGDEGLAYFQSIIKDKKVYNYPRQYYECPCRTLGVADDYYA